MKILTLFLVSVISVTAKHDPGDVSLTQAEINAPLD